MTAATREPSEQLPDAYPLFRLTQSVTAARRPEEIYEAALLCLRESIGVTKSSILLFDRDGVMRFKAWVDLSPAYREAVEGHSPWTKDTRDPQPVLVEDVREDAALEELAPAIEAEGICALAFVPLVSDGRLIGKFMLYYPAPHSFSEQEVVVAQTIAAQVAFALDQQQAHAERRLSEALLAGQKHSLELLARGSPLRDVLTSLVQIVENLADGEAIGSILLVDDEKRIRDGASPSLPRHYVEAIDGLPVDPNLGTCCAAAARGEPVITSDIEHDPNWAGLSHLPLGIGLKAAWSQPVFARDGKVLATFGTYFREVRPPTDNERRIVEVLAQTAAIAIESSRAEHEVRSQREHIDAMFHSVVTGIIEIDAEARFRVVNDRFCEMVGHSREELLELDCYAITHPDDRDSTREWIESLLAGAPHFTIEKRYLRADGSEVWVSKSVSAIRDEQGALRGAVGVVSDITERKLSEAALQASEEQYRGLVSSLGLAVYTTDAEGRIRLFNEAAADLWGRRPEIGVDFWCGSWRIYTPDGADLPLGECPMAIALLEGRPVRDVELIVERPDGGRRWILPYPTPLHDASGRLIGAVNVLIDITARKQAEMELERRNGLIQSISDNMSVGLLTLDSEGCIEFMNPAAEQITGYSFEDVRGASAHEKLHYLHPDGTPYDTADCPIMRANGESMELQRHTDVFVRPDGSFYDVVCNVAPLIRDGVRLGAILDVRDVTVEKQAERALIESEETLRAAADLKDQFLGLVSHELRTPIATIMGNGLLLLRRFQTLPLEDRQQALADIVSEADKLQEIIENLLLLTRLEAGHLDLEPLLLSRLLDEAIAEFKKLNPDRIVEVSIEEIPPALGQQTLVSLVLRNLLSNAGKYSPPDTRIEVHLGLQDGDIEVSVRDYGIGLDESDVENVFIPFYRSPRAKLQAKGMGLGLAVCKRVVEAQDGTILVTSQPGEGSRFSFTLHAAEAPGL